MGCPRVAPVPLMGAVESVLTSEEARPKKVCGWTLETTRTMGALESWALGKSGSSKSTHSQGGCVGCQLTACKA